ncbi:SDR family oxidoreductase [Aquabacterium sp.]|uniref:SDR family oxidoreductase n=1 Tax=Aquabacterium sp. TaxID=1872578 RepID=UPI002E34DF3B|nr:SDR family oxidoreductase [Aquabacterium sp.]HEX5312280.1 SDR family oxidoreductase [Aquabacterium sp.]
MSTVFVTGSTGFLGSHFLINFIGTRFERAFVLIRGASDEIRRNKLLSALKLAGESYREMPNLDALLSRVTIVEGDISQENFGVSEPVMTALRAAKIDQFWHFAASLNYEEHRREMIKATNIDGAKFAANFCKAAGIGRFVHISTAYTCGLGNGPVPEALHSLETPFSNYYEESKCNAEHALVEACQANGMPLTIFRPSMVIGNSQTKSPGGSDTALYGFMREVRRLKGALRGMTDTVRVLGMPDGEVNFVPVDQLMIDIGLVLDQGLADGEIYHLSSDFCPRTERSFGMICEQLGMENLKLVRRSEDTALNKLERVLEDKLSFYASYINSRKQFERKIPRSHGVTEEEFLAYVAEGMKHLPAEDTTAH